MTTEQEQTTTPTPVAFKAEVRQLLDILAHSLYTDREIFLRELISNASDALHRVQFEMLTNQDVRDPDAELAIYIDADKDAKTITITDTGIGMTRDDMVENLGTIAQSGARAFLKRVSESEQKSGSEIIGQFGVGFYSVFMVADKVTVISRSYQPDAEAVQWEATGGDTYTIQTAEREQRGTTIIIQLKEDASEFANTWRLEQIIKRHSDFIDSPIYMGSGEEQRQVNQQKPLWRRTPRDVPAEDYNNFYKQLTMDMEDPLWHIHLSTDAPLDLHTVLFIPSRRERGMLERRVEGKIKLYSRKVLIQEENKDLLPHYFRFIEGVVDSEDIPLNISRETVQSNVVMQRLKKTITSRVFRELNDLIEKEPEKYAKFWEEFGPFLKEGLATDFEGRDELLKLLRFNTTHNPEELSSLADYKSRMNDDQEEIYYVLAADREAALRSPHLDPLSARGLEVLLLTDVMDSFMLTNLREYEGKKLRNIDDANLELPGEADQGEDMVSDEEFAQLSERIKAVLGDRITEVRASKVLRDSAARLVSAEDAPGREMHRIQQLLGQEVSMAPRMLELNRAHPLVAQLARRTTANADDPVTAAIAEQLYDNALLLEGLHQNPTAMVSRIQALMEAAARAE
jgi:molecular chaperone HtpG